MMMSSNATLCAHRKLAVLVFVCRRWRIIGTKDKVAAPANEIQQWIEEHALAEMAKAGHFKDLRPATTDVGGFKRVHVSDSNISNMDYFGEPKWFVCLQGYKSASERPTKLFSRVQYNCPYRWRCHC